MLQSEIIEKIEKQFGSKIVTAKDFEALSKSINNQVKQTVSSTTLRRAFGNLKYRGSLSRYTLEALANYLGYQDWESLILDIESSKELDLSNLVHREKLHDQRKKFSLINNLNSGLFLLIGLVIVSSVIAINYLISKNIPLSKNAITPANINQGLQLYLPFNGNSNDASGNRNNGLVYGCKLTKDRFGHPNSAYSFNGANNYICVPFSRSLALNSDMSISVWINFKGGKRNPRILALNASNNIDNGMSGGGYEIWMNGPFNAERTFSWCYCRPTIGLNCNQSILITGSHWHNIIVTFSFRKLEGKTFIDGKIVSTVKTLNFGLIDYHHQNLYIGCINPRREDFYGGMIDDIRIYGRELEKSEITYLATH